jgi:hypothetical protein
MPPEEKPATSLVALRDAREQAIAQLSDAFAHDLIGVDEFEHRLTLAHRADTVAEVEQTVSDLTATAHAAALVPARAQPPVRATERESASLLALFGGVERRGPWTLPRRLQAFAILGGIVLDFREALLSPGVTEIYVLALLGGAQIIVPPGLSVEVSGTAIMGGFGHMERIAEQLDPDRPVLRVHGLAIMGGVAVETRLPGESEKEAHKRRRRDRRDRHALGGPGEPRRLPEKTGR